METLHFCRRYLVSAASALLTITLLASCGDNKTSALPQPVSDGQTTTAVVTEAETEPMFDDDLPDDLDFGGQTFTYLTRDSGTLHTNFLVEELNGDVLNDAMFNCNLEVERQLNIEFVEVSSPEFGKQNSEAKRSIAAGENAYDVIYCEDYPTLNIATMGYLLDFESLPYVDLTKSYWSQTMNPSLPIHNHLFFAHSDNNLTPTDYTHVLLFNKDMAKDYGLPDLYEEVRNGGWDFELYASCVSGVTGDVDGDGVMTKSDRYGYLAHPKYVLPAFWQGAGLKSIKKDENDDLVFDLPYDRQFIDIYEQIMQMTWDNNSWAFFDEGSVYNGPLFEGGHSLFIDMSLGAVINFRSAELLFGILPYPKYDEAQESYHSRVENGCVPGIPVTSSEKLDMIGAVLEYWAAVGQKTIKPAYFDMTLKGKSSRDTESEDMLDIIYDTRNYDLGDTYLCDQLRDGVFKGMFEKNKRDFVSTMTKREASINKYIDKLNAACAALDD
ncbi:MAG: hypothetical protein IJT56_00440 [Clostridia bacterium]|nr:hypothetical protein [Clostridia bacterium]